MSRHSWLAALILLLAACAHAGPGGAGGPTERPGCASCHVAGEPRLKADVLTVCRGCHTTAHGTLQASDPGSGMACNSCHDPHGVHGVLSGPRH